MYKITSKSCLLMGLFALLLTANSCYMGKELEVSKTIAIIDESGSPVILNSVDDHKYLYHTPADSLKSEFLDACIAAFPADNITVVGNDENPDFTLVISKIEYKETRDEHTVDDPDSEYNGQTYYLHECEVSASGMLYEGNKEQVLKTVSVMANKEEKVKNNRNLGDLISGDNKDNNTYRHKELQDDIFEDLFEKTGRRMEAETSTKIYRLVKKGKV